MKRNFFFLIAVIMILSACSLFFSKPEVKIKSVEITGLDPTYLNIEVLASVKNPNSFDIKLSGYTYDLKVHALPVSNGGSAIETIFPANRQTEVRLPLQLSVSSLYELLKRQPDPDRISYSIKGNIQLATPLGDQLIPFEKTDFFSIPLKYRPSYWADKVKESLKSFIIH